jgi:hypothetical protein
MPHDATLQLQTSFKHVRTDGGEVPRTSIFFCRVPKPSHLCLMRWRAAQMRWRIVIEFMFQTLRHSIPKFSFLSALLTAHGGPLDKVDAFN